MTDLNLNLLGSDGGLILQTDDLTLADPSASLVLDGIVIADPSAIDPETLARLQERYGEKLEEILATFAGSAKNEVDKHRQASDTEFYFTLAFQTREAKDEFLRKTGWVDLGDKYLCGELVANRMGIPMTIPVPGMPSWTVSRKLQELVGEDL